MQNITTPIVSIHSSKGGVGKTTLAALLALKAAHSGLHACLIDLDFTGPGLHHILQVEEPKEKQAILDYIIAPQDNPCGAAKVNTVHSIIPAEVMKDIKGVISFIGGRIDYSKAIGIQAYLLADVRASLLQARLHMLILQTEQLAIENKQKIDLFILDTPPSLLGASGVARELVKKANGFQIFITSNNQQSLIGFEKMLLGIDDQDSKDMVDKTYNYICILNDFDDTNPSEDDLKTILDKLRHAAININYDLLSDRAGQNIIKTKLLHYKNLTMPRSEELRNISEINDSDTAESQNLFEIFSKWQKMVEMAKERDDTPLRSNYLFEKINDLFDWISLEIAHRERINEDSH